MTTDNPSAHIVLVPGFWLGAWAWDEVAELLGAGGHDVTAVTLPGLESVEADRSGVSLDDHVTAICGVVSSLDRPVVLVVHSGAGVPGYEVTDRLPDRIAATVYVDTGPATGALGAGFEGDEYPLPPLEELSQQENLDGLTDAHLERFYARAVPQPGGALRDAPNLSNPARLDIPSTVVCTSFDQAAYRQAASEGQEWLGGLTELRDVTYIDMPTSHWPMWSRPGDLAEIIGDIASS